MARALTKVKRPSGGPDPLATYNAKRDFTKTAEPPGELPPAPSERRVFMVQKHAATRLHWDLRLELDGVLKSWAVTRGPSPNPDDKRLAVRTEDHPLAYATFEGTIPKGEYGGGTVMLWDRGWWEPIPGKTADTLPDGHLHFILHGERMKGEWLLIRLKPRPGERAENWLLRKVADEHYGGSDDLVERCVTSVATGRSMEEIAAGVAEAPPAKALRQAQGGRGESETQGGQVAGEAQGGRGKAKPRGQPADMAAPRKRGPGKQQAALPAFREPQLCTLVDSVPSGRGWLHEMKYDGYRLLAAVAGGTARLYTRNGLDWTDRFPEVAATVAALPGAALLDGEVVALDAEGRPDFSTLQAAIKEQGGRGLTYFAFDLLEEDGADLAALPNLARKERLRALVPDGDGPLRYAEHVVGKGEALFAAMCARGLEGVVSKKADAAYAGRRSAAWLKIKCTRRQEFVVIGWTASEARMRGFSSLLLAVNEGGGLRYAGKVGTGFDTKLLADIRARLDALATDTPAAKVPRPAARGAYWVRPELVAEVAFAEFTADDVVRHASFVGLREDKRAGEVVVERVGAGASTGSGPAREAKRSAARASRPHLNPSRAGEGLEQAAAEPARPAPVEGPRAAAPAPAYRITNPDRVIDAASGATKGQLADFYAAVAPILLGTLARRPVSLVRCPQGRGKQCFFQKHDAGSFGPAVHHVPITEGDGDTEDYLWVDSAEGVMACVQMNTIEFHGWGSRIDTLEQPDRLVIDLDPDEDLDFTHVREAALDLRRILADMGLVSFPMLSGGKGVHVVVPLTPAAEWPAVKDWAHRFALALEQAEPERFVANMAKAERRGRIFVDYLRNQRGATAVLPYVARARDGMPVSAPVTWEELREAATAKRFGLGSAAELLARAGSADLKGWGEASQTLPEV